jgi:CSLREA domain-containing protein
MMKLPQQFNHRIVPFAALPILAGAPFFSFSAAASAQANITVTTQEDELNADGDCSLREAIEAANRDRAVDACPAGSGYDTELRPVNEDQRGTARPQIDNCDIGAYEATQVDLLHYAFLPVCRR